MYSSENSTYCSKFIKVPPSIAHSMSANSSAWHFTFIYLLELETSGSQPWLHIETSWGKFTIYWCLDLTPRGSDVSSLGCIKIFKNSLSDSDVQPRLRITYLEQHVSSFNVYSNCLVQKQTLIQQVRSQLWFCISNNQRCYWSTLWVAGW